MNEAIVEILGSRLPGVIATTFKRMEIAEQEIRAAMDRWPLQAEAIDRDAFLLLCPPPVLGDLGEEVYRRHARELLDRFVKGEDLTNPTAAEICAVMLAGTLKAPPNSTVSALYARHFIRLFPERADLAEDLARGVYVSDSLVDDLEGSICRALARENADRKRGSR